MSYAIVIVIVSILVALLIREVVCWYFKFNKIVQLLESIESKLQRQGIPDKPEPVNTEQPKKNRFGGLNDGL